MNIPEIIFPFLAAFFYCISIILVKYATRAKTLSGTSILVVNNMLSGLTFIPLILLDNTLPSLSNIWQPLLASAFCAVGNLATFICAERGEVSLMTPIMGIKILFVIMLSNIMLNNPLPHTITISGAICCLAVFIMGFSRKSISADKLRITILLAITACASYAICDVLMQKYAHNFTRYAMLSLTSVAMPLSVIPFIPRLIREIPHCSKRTLIFGFSSGLFMLMEMYLMFRSIVGEVGASLCNILFNTRGLISIVLIFILGKFLSELKELNKSSALQRTIGASLILLAVAIALR